MRLTAAFFANRVEVVNSMLDVEGAFWSSVTVAPDAPAFLCNTVVLCEVDDEDIGRQFTLIIDGEGPTGRHLPAFSFPFKVDSHVLFMCMPSMALPIETGGGFHRYRFRLDGQHERVEVRIAVRPALA